MPELEDQGAAVIGAKPEAKWEMVMLSGQGRKTEVERFQYG